MLWFHRSLPAAAAAVALLIAAPGDAAAQQTQSRLFEITQSKRLKVCVFPLYYAISFRNPRTGQLEGIDADLSKELAKELGAEIEYVAPWRSVYKFHLFTDTALTFVLTSGGHNAGIVSEPGHPNRHYRIATRLPEARYVDPDRWVGRATTKDGSWWPEWTTWLGAQSSGMAAPPAMGAPDGFDQPLADAPGRYVLMP
jgi:hypothetical protein